MSWAGIDQVVDLGKYPWPWKDKSVDMIYASHILEHFADQKQFLSECIRILKPGGKLRITAPHASCIPSVGCLGHYRTYSLYTFNDYLCKPWYMFQLPQFKTIEQRLNFWYEKSGEEVPIWARPIFGLLNAIMNPIINAQPRIYENFFANIIPCREIIWVGEKL